MEKQRKRKKNWLYLVLLPLLILSACGNDKKEEAQKNVRQDPYADRQFLMGTYVQIKIYDEGKEPVVKEAFERVKELADKITVNEPGSEIDDVNENAGIKPVKVTPDVYELVQEAYDYTVSSDGGFDLAIGPITNLWRIGFPDARKPSQSEIDEALKLVNYHNVELNSKEQTVFLKEKGMRLDLGAIAKGYITDKVVELLKEKGVTTAIVDLGGNIYVLGYSPTGEKKDWTVGIQDPNQERNKIVGKVPAHNQSLVTSGIYERNLTVGDETFHHLFNSKTGYPFDNDIAGVTIISKRSVDGDALSTVVFAKGVKEGLAYVEGLKDVEAIFVTKEEDVYLSSGIKDKFELNKEAGYKIKDIKDWKNE